MILCKNCKYWNHGECVDIDIDNFNDMKREGSDRAL